jgi:putative tryptophan/tyrosine transport system substrate-binding protein
MTAWIGRRELITLLGGAAAAWPLAARAQSARIFRIGFLGPALTSPPPISYYRAFLTELRSLGFVEGTNLAVEYRPQDDPRGTFAAAADLMRSRPELIVVSGGEVALQAVVGASIAVPIVLIAVNFDPIERRYVTSLARSGGNITGVVFRQLEFAPKQVELLAEAFPSKTRLAALFDAQTADQFDAAERAAKVLQMQVQPIKLEKLPYDFDGAFREAAARGAQIILVLSSTTFTQYRPQIAQSAIDHHLPAMYTFRHYVDAGGLMSYGVDFATMFRRAADYVGRILKGANPADLPVEQATKFEMVVNLKTAKTMGIELPTSILLRADEVIE